MWCTRILLTNVVLEYLSASISSHSCQSINLHLSSTVCKHACTCVYICLYTCVCLCVCAICACVRECVCVSTTLLSTCYTRSARCLYDKINNHLHVKAFVIYQNKCHINVMVVVKCLLVNQLITPLASSVYTMVYNSPSYLLAIYYLNNNTVVR